LILLWHISETAMGRVGEMAKKTVLPSGNAIKLAVSLTHPSPFPVSPLKTPK
jgi:hypothetical protein